MAIVKVLNGSTINRKQKTEDSDKFNLLFLKHLTNLKGNYLTMTENNNNIEVIGLQSPLFAGARNGLATAIIGLISHMDELGFESGELNMKIVIELRDELVNRPATELDANGKEVYESHVYKSPIVHHQITHTLKQTTKYAKGNITADGMELKRDEDGILVLVPVATSQMQLE